MAPTITLPPLMPWVLSRQCFREFRILYLTEISDIVGDLYRTIVGSKYLDEHRYAARCHMGSCLHSVKLLNAGTDTGIALKTIDQPKFFARR